MTVDWDRVAGGVDATLARHDRLDPGQRDSLAWIAGRLRRTAGVVLADEVGTGKTRIACALVHAVLAAGGRVATVVPKGLMHQWVAESRQLDGTVAPNRLTTLPELFRTALTEPWDNLAPHPDRPEWCLLSHNFRVPQVRSNSHTWRAALPALVELQLASRADRNDRRTREGKLDAWLGLTDKHTTKRWAFWDGMERLAKDVATRVKPRADLRRAIRQLPDLRIVDTGDRVDVNLDAEKFRDAGGERVSEEILGLWLGEFDLIVVDEAHKSRGEIEDDDTLTNVQTAKVLTRLLDLVLKPSPTSRRLCLTATPMELDLEQWGDLLARAGRCLSEDERKVVVSMKETTRDAAAAPDEVARLDRLCDAAGAFTRLLSPHVTRRRRVEDPLIQEVKARGGGERGPHPHRRVTVVPIGWSDPAVRANAWIDVLFAAEGMSHAARGLTRADTDGWPRAIRDAYTKLCKGHVSADFDEYEGAIPIPAEDESDVWTRGKIARVDYWYRQLRAARARGEADPTAADGLVESEHPRITLAVRQIESWTEGTAQGADVDGEKVLVFGVFRRPLHVLRDVLNVRHALRAVDAGQPIAHAVDRELMTIVPRQVARMRADGGLTGRLASASDSGVRRALRRGRDEYDALQRRLRGVITDQCAAWARDPRRLGTIDDPRVRAQVRAHAMAFVLDELISMAEARAAATPARVAQLADDYFEQHLAPELVDLDSDDDDDARAQAVRAVFLDDSDTRQRRFAVVLEGDTKPQTRRYIQAAFNRPSSSPRVLIAQSQVGREGLNLHEACRVVVQFHPEWNPAVVEQQIGRVDRKNSLWERRARAWLAGGAVGPLPCIEVQQLVFDGTYDAFQRERVGRRQHMFDASLFGSLLPEEAWARVPPDRVQKLEEAAPAFRPRPHDVAAARKRPGR